MLDPELFLYRTQPLQANELLAQFSDRYSQAPTSIDAGELDRIAYLIMMELMGTDPIPKVYLGYLASVQCSKVFRVNNDGDSCTLSFHEAPANKPALVRGILDSITIGNPVANFELEDVSGIPDEFLSKEVWLKLYREFDGTGLNPTSTLYIHPLDRELYQPFPLQN